MRCLAALTTGAAGHDSRAGQQQTQRLPYHHAQMFTCMRELSEVRDAVSTMQSADDRAGTGWLLLTSRWGNCVRGGPGSSTAWVQLMISTMESI